MLDTVLGLPVHPLIVHATVVVVPTAALAVALYAVWPRFRAWARFGPLALAAAAVVLTPLSTSSGESLEHRVGGSAAIEQQATGTQVLRRLAGTTAWAWRWSRRLPRPRTGRSPRPTGRTVPPVRS